MPKYHPARVDVLCQNCGKQFSEKQCRIADGRGRYCCKACLYDYRRRPTEERFWLHVVKGDGCWFWSGIDTGHHQSFYLGGKKTNQVGAHVFSYELHCGPVPEGLFVRHKCDKPSCVRPDHLELGTPKENTGDAVNRRRMKMGERQWLAKFTEAQIREIRARVASGEITQYKLAKEYGVTEGCINSIIKRRSWKHVV